MLRPCRHRHPGGAHDRRRQPDGGFSLGTDDQIRGFKNSSLANTVSGVYTALYSFFDADLPRNEGSFRGVTIIAPEGSVVNGAPARTDDHVHGVSRP